jgi:hypothetical protein
MQLKAVKPSHCAFPGFSHILKNTVPLNSLVVTDGDFGAVHECNTGTFTETDGIEEKHHGDKNSVLNLHKTIV